MHLSLPLQRFQRWLETAPERVWLRQPVDGTWRDFTWRHQARRLAAGRRATCKQFNEQLMARERLSHLLLVQDSWTVGSVCMTPTMKIRRNVLEARYAERVASLPAQPALHWENRT